MELISITIEEFENTIYDEYVKCFPEQEQRDWNNIRKTYTLGVEKFYKIIENDDLVGFFMLEENTNNNSYYIDYFAIYEQYRNKGLGTLAIKHLLSDVVRNKTLCIEIEKPTSDDPDTIRRKNFYINLGFKDVGSLYLLYDVFFVPLVYSNAILSKDKVDEMMFDYYLINCGKEVVDKRCKIIN